MKKLILLGIFLLTVVGFAQKNAYNGLVTDVVKVGSFSTIVTDSSSAVVTTDKVSFGGADSVALIIEATCDTATNGSLSNFVAYNWPGGDSVVINCFLQPLTPNGLADTTTSKVLGGTSTVGGWIYLGQKTTTHKVFFSTASAARPSSYQYGRIWIKVNNWFPDETVRVKFTVYMVRLWRG